MQNILVHCEFVNFSNIAIALLDFSLLLPIQLSFFELYDSKSCRSLPLCFISISVLNIVIQKHIKIVVQIHAFQTGNFEDIINIFADCKLFCVDNKGISLIRSNLYVKQKVGISRIFNVYFFSIRFAAAMSFNTY